MDRSFALAYWFSHSDRPGPDGRADAENVYGFEATAAIRDFERSYARAHSHHCDDGMP